LETNKNGSIKVQGLTMLPPGPLFVRLCLLSFGLIENDRFDNLAFVRKWMGKGYSSAVAEQDWSRRIYLAIQFNIECKHQGESLVCFPYKVRSLCEIFDGVDGHSFGSWNADDSPFAIRSMRTNTINAYDIPLAMPSVEINSVNAYDNLRVSSSAAHLRETKQSIPTKQEGTASHKVDATDRLTPGKSSNVAVADKTPNSDCVIL